MDRRTCLALLSLLLTVASTHALAAVGRTPGTFNVSPTGAATYAIPIWAPPGPRGIQPALSLIYNSQSGAGTLGVGWSLAGLGSIYRCNETYAQDTTIAPVALVTSDGYCLNGNRLRLTGGTYGTAGSTYQTEIANFSNVTANGTAGNGPAYFTVQGKDGLTYQYGYTDANGYGANSQVRASGSTTAITWLLSKVTDRAGNSMAINYIAGTSTAVPGTIYWTPSSAGSSTYNYQMIFTYTTNNPQTSVYGYVAGAPVTNVNLLTDVTVTYTGTTVKKYVLTYQTSPTTGRNELKQVQECADSGATNCLAPTTVTYQSGTLGISGTATTAVSSAPQILNAKYDFNGDGYPDLVYYSGSTWYVVFGSASGYGTPVNTGVTSASALFGDLQGKGTDEILANNGGTYYYYTWNGSSFTGASTGLVYDSAVMIADVDGDGLPDLIYLSVEPGTQGYVDVTTRLNTSTPSGVSFSSSVIGAYSSGPRSILTARLIFPDREPGPLRAYDFNGDGRKDLALVIESRTNPIQYYYYQLLSTGRTFTGYLLGTGSQGYTWNPVFINWNDDACTDTIWNGTLYISSCNGTAGGAFSVPGGNVLTVANYDGAGRGALLVPNGSTIGVYLSTGTGISSSITPTSIPYSSSCTYFTFDANGDGLDDLGCWNQTSPNPVTYYLHNGAGVKPDLATAIVDGYGNSVSPTYVSIVQSNYQKYSDAIFPYQNYIGPSYVTSQVVFSDPSNMPSGTYNQQYYYYGAWTNLQGRGFQSFYATRTLDSRNALYDYQYFERSFPYNGMKFQDIVEASSGTFYIGQFTATPAMITLDGTANNGRYFPYFSNVITYQREVGGPENGDLITTASTNYTYDNYGNATTVATTVTDNDPGSPYVNDTWTTTTVNTIAPNTSTWCLTLPTETQVTNSSTAPGGAAITRTVSYTPDYTNCRETQKVTEPNSSTYKVTDAYTFDSFGNLWTDTVTGVGMAARVTTITWGTTGQFPTTISNPLSQSITRGYDPESGRLTSQTDPNWTSTNPIQTTWGYDPFQRKTSEVRPDGTSTTWAYNSCTTNGCVNSNNQMTVTKTVVNVGGSTQSVTNTYLDSVDRTLVTSSTMLSGAYDRNEVQYDNLGRIHQQGAPCTFISCTSYWTTNTYDSLNRLTQSQRPISATNGTLQTRMIQYAGRTTTVTDPQLKNTTKINLVTGNLARTQDHNGYYINFKYDAFGSVLSVTDSLSNTLNTMTYDYGLQAFQRTSNDADLGARSSTYNALGELTAYSDAKGQNFSAIYDALSRPTSRTEPDLTTTWTWGNTATSFNIGKIQGVAAASSVGTYSEAYGYDSKTRLSTEQISIPGDAAYTYTRTYNATTGLLDTLQYPVSTSGYQLKLQYAYQNGILQQVSDVATGTHYWTANALNPRGQLTQETLGNGVVVNHALDAVTGWVSSIQAGAGGGAALQNNSYLFDEVGNLTQRQDNNLGLTENVYPDSLYRLDHTVGDSNTQVTYDGMGRILTWAAYGKATVTNNFTTPQSGCTYYANSQLHAVRGSTAGTQPPQSFCYDANGNMTTITASGVALGSVAWTSFNQPSSIISGTTSGQLFYNADHQRYKQVASYAGSPETTMYVGGLLEKVINSSGTAYRHYIPAGSNTVVYTRLSTGSTPTYYITKDHLGSSAAITDQTGTLIVKEKFGAWGYNENTAAEQATIATVSRHEYTGQEQINNTGVLLTNMNGRIYSAVGSMFLSPDPYTPHPDNTQSYNRYSYVNNNPLTLVDPSGYQPQAMEHCMDGCPFPNFGGIGFWGISGYQSDGDRVPVPRGSVGYTTGNGSAADGRPGGAIAAFNQWVSGWIDGTHQSNSAGNGEPFSTAIAAGNTTAGSAQGQTSISMAPSDDGFAPIVVNAPPNAASSSSYPTTYGNYSSGTFPCGGVTCSFQASSYRALTSPYITLGATLKVKYPGSGGGSWVQTFTRDDGGGAFVLDGNPFYPPNAFTNGNQFYDQPGLYGSGFFLAQTSLVQPNSSGGYSAAFTFMWGFQYSLSGQFSLIGPIPAAIWSSQQQNIGTLHQ